MSWEQDQLDAWSREYGIGTVHFVGYRPLGDYAGMTYHSGYPKNIWVGVAVDEAYDDHRTVARCVLWHEFAHAWCFYQRGRTGHDKTWLRFYMKKPGLVLGAFLAPFVRW